MHSSLRKDCEHLFTPHLVVIEVQLNCLQFLDIAREFRDGVVGQVQQSQLLQATERCWEGRYLV